MDRADVWLVMPVYNEATVLAGVLSEVLSVFPNVVCVDDGSGDDSAAVIAASGAALVRHPVNCGQGAALQTGIEYARERPGVRYIVTFDADGQHRPDDAVAMVARLRRDEADLVLGTRFGVDSSHVPPVRRAVLRLAALLSPTARRLGLTDVHNGLRAFTRTVADRLDLTCSGMGHASEFLTVIDRSGWRVVEHPVRITYSPYSVAKGQSLLNGVNIAFDSVLRRPR